MSKALSFLKTNEALFQQLIDSCADSGDYIGDYDYDSALETLQEIKEAIAEIKAKDEEIDKLKEKVLNERATRRYEVRQAIKKARRIIAMIGWRVHTLRLRFTKAFKKDSSSLLCSEICVLQIEHENSYNKAKQILNDDQ
jgi:phage shock protein A